MMMMMRGKCIELIYSSEEAWLSYIHASGRPIVKPVAFFGGNGFTETFERQRSGLLVLVRLANHPNEYSGCPEWGIR
jgi:hypothetical protein